eukprot:3774975-Prymnesium_polylepis.1
MARRACHCNMGSMRVATWQDARAMAARLRRVRATIRVVGQPHALRADDQRRKEALRRLLSRLLARPRRRRHLRWQRDGVSHRRRCGSLGNPTAQLVAEDGLTADG